MKSIFDNVSFDCSVKVTKAYSTSFSSAVKMLAPSIRQDIYNIYGFVRFADEIVDSFHDYDKEALFSILSDKSISIEIIGSIRESKNLLGLELKVDISPMLDIGVGSLFKSTVIIFFH